MKVLQPCACFFLRCVQAFAYSWKRGVTQELLSCESAGLMCLLAAALPKQYLLPDSPAASKFPSWELEFDMRGRMEISADDSFGYIDIGEVKSSADFSSAIPQLGLRLKAVEWAVKAVRPGLADIRLVGRLVAPSRAIRGKIRAKEQQTASKDWGFSLYVHAV